MAGDATEGTHMAGDMSGDMDSFVSCSELLLEGHILVAPCVFAGVVAAGVGLISKESISFPFTFPHRYTMCKRFSICPRTELLINRPFATSFETTAIGHCFGVVHSSISTKSTIGAQ